MHKDCTMTAYICETCGTQFPESEEPPRECPICQDERQYVGHQGQRWTTLDALRSSHRNRIEPVAQGVFGIGSEPQFAIGQRALLVQSPHGNVLWDCVALLDDDTVRWVESLGGISAMAISHPHYYTTMVEWARTFDVPIHIHEADRRWVMRPDPSVHYWEGDVLPLQDDMDLVRLGGHFAGGQVLHWKGGAQGRGALLTGDIIQVVQDARWVSFMYSYPNLIPLSAQEVRRIADAVEPLDFEHIHGAWWGRHVLADAKGAVHRSADRYIRALESPHA